MPRRFAIIDYETFSEAELSLKKKGVGAYEYCAHPSSEILCVAWRIGTREELVKSTEKDTKVWTPRWNDKRSDLSGFLNTLLDPDLTLVAHNAFFEQCVTRLLFAEKYMYSMKDKILAATRPERWYCTQAQAQALALPRSLEKIGDALNLSIKKDKEGGKIAIKWSKPRKPTKDNPATRHTDGKEFERLVDYCRADIASEIDLFVSTPMLSKAEQEFWHYDQKINLRGFRVDRRLIESALSMVGQEKQELQRQVLELSGGEIHSINSQKQVFPFLQKHGCFLPNYQAETIEAAIDEGLAKGVALELLEIRQALGKTSVSKYEVAERLSRLDGRIRGSINYHGASTGRASGNGFQPQNMPRPPRWLKDTIAAAETIAEGDLEMLRLLYGQPLMVLSGCLRNLIVPSPGKLLHVIDWSSIETRVLFWITEDHDGVQAFRDGRKLYEEQAAKIFGVTTGEIGSDSFERFVGKETVLGCGYQMGWKALIEACRKKKVIVPPKVANTAIETYRREHKSVVDFWKNIERAAVNAVSNPGKEFSISRGRILFYTEGDFLFCQLPSGRRIAYYKPEVRWEPNRWGNKQPKLYFWGAGKIQGSWVHQSTYGGKLTENVVQAIARDILASAIIRTEKAGWEVVCHVHDEIVAEIPSHKTSDTNSLKQFKRLCSKSPSWAQDCPLEVTGFESNRYRKG